MKIKENGITLVVLVVTVIILLILAGVTIMIVTKDEGLFSKSQESTNIYKDAEIDEQEKLVTAENEIGKYLIGSNKDGGENPKPPDKPEEIIGETTREIISKISGDETEPTEVTIGGKKLIIPPSFTISEESADTVDGGIVVKDKRDNEWVWIPCYVDGGVNDGETGVLKFDRCDFGVRHDTYESYTEDTIEEQNNSIFKYGGFYIGRYESGKEDGRLVIKKNRPAYVDITCETMKSLSIQLASDCGYNTNKIETYICSSYAWDTSLKFIGGDYATNSPKENYTGSIKSTGLTKPMCNIYDMDGNVYEYTSELYQKAYPTLRGGCEGENGGKYQPGYRSFGGFSVAYNYVGFRTILVLK